MTINQAMAIGDGRTRAQLGHASQGKIFNDIFGEQSPALEFTFILEFRPLS